MAQVTITVNGRRHDVGCDDGEEERLSNLAARLDQRVRSLVAKVGQIGEARLLLLACLLVEDELSEARLQLAAATGDALTIPAIPQNPQAGPNGGSSTGASQDAAAIAEALEALAGRIEAVVAGLPRP